MKRLRLLLVVLLLHSIAMAQTRQLSGTVTDSKTGNPLISVTVKVTGRNTAAVTGNDGKFSLAIPSGAVSLEFSYVGYATKTVAVAEGETVINVTLDEQAGTTSEVVVTALGISKAARKLGYAVTTVGGDQLNKARETNVANSLSGRVAGLKVTGSSGGPGGTAKVLLRGMPSMNSGGSPLYIINGVPMDNSQRGSSGEWGGSDNGDGIGNLNPDDIETMTVLKGQSASALYGARASNGVIIITTKTGKKGNFSVDYNSNFMADKAMNNTDFQYEYGQGTGGAKPSDALSARNSNRMSWGSKLDGSQVIQFDGNSYAYSAVKDNMSRFYRTGTTFTNTVSLSNGSEFGSFRLSLSNMDNNSIVRNSGLDRKTINLNAEAKVTPKLTVNVSANYVDEKSTNRAQLSDGPMNPNNFQFLATNVDQKIFAPGFDPVSGFETQFSDDEYVSNPWFVVNQYVNNLGRKRLITSSSARYNFTDWLYAQARIGYDLSNDDLFRVEPWGTAYTADKHGNLQDLAKSSQYELNLDALVGVTRKLTQDINLDVALGANKRKNQYEKTAVGGSYFLVPYLYTLSNVRNPRTDPNSNYDFWKTEINSGYYTVDLAYKNFLTLNTTGRYDAYSTLPINDNKIFTPSVSASLVFSELTNIKNLNFGKLRVSYAQTSGELTEAYKTALYYSLGSPLGGIPLGNFSTDLPNLFLKPFVTTEFEIGTELRFLNSRLNFDVAWFTKKTKNEIMPATYSPATGATSGFVGTGSTRNSGLEVQVTATPVKGKDFSWISTANFTAVSNKILQTDADNKNQNLGQNRGTLGNAVTSYVVGFAGPQILAYDYARSAKGEMIVDGSGLPVRGDLIKLGSVLPKYYGGWNNEFNYKNLNLSFLVDYNFGNKILSATEYYALRRGLHKMTLVGRDGITTGVHADGTANTTQATAQDYYTALANNVTSTSVVSGDYIKLRQITLGYTISGDALKNVPLFSAIQISFVARNLAILMRKSDNIDPEANFASSIRYAGIEGTSLPSTRSFGINLNLKFKK